MTNLTRLLFVTGDRAEYDLIYPILEHARHSDDFYPLIAASGSHLVPRYGETVSEIEADGFEIIARIDSLFASDHPAARAKSLAAGIAGMVDVVVQHRPDMLVVLGDREESLAAATVGTYARIPVVHLGGGDRADDGNSDNPIRDAVSKLAHIHLATSQKSYERLLELGEEAWRCFAIGATGLDRLRTVPHLTPDALWREMGIAPIVGRYAIMIQHPLLPEHDQARAQIIETLEALVSINLPVFVGRPNSDPGNYVMHEEIDRYAALYPNIQPFRNLNRRAFVNLLRGASVLVGNSSAGILEAPFLNLPVVNIGRRQIGREHSENVIFVDHERNAIARAIFLSLNDAEHLRRVRECINPYGDGNAAPRALRILRQLRADKPRLLDKRQTRKK